MNVYDFDKTIYTGDSTIDFWLFALRHRPSIIQFLPYQLKAAYLFRKKRITKDEFKESFYVFFNGIPDIEKMTHSFWARHKTRFAKWYVNQRNPDDVIITASPEFLVKAGASFLSIDNVIGTLIDPKTGKALSKNCSGNEKLNRFREQYPSDSIDSFYSDSYSDIALARIAKQAFLVKHGAITKWVL